jgi:putative phosphoserine phosphatase/1-acylglycerol-3-phosphate O-acyltransferase
MIHAWEDHEDLSLLETVSGIARYWLAYGSAIPAAMAGFVAGAASGSRWTGINVLGGLWADLGGAFMGIEPKVKGEEHLWSSRPCVFIFNHQSAIDPLLCARLIRRDTFGIAKKELRQKPVAGAVIGLMGTVFIDRADHVKAVEALRPAVEEIRRGRSMIIAPEGHRSPDGKLLPFKKGAFYVAMQAGVPLVPLVIHDAYKRLRPGSGIARPGTVHVTVLPPIPTERWKATQINRHIADVRAIFLRELGQDEEEPTARPRRAARRAPRRRPAPEPGETS